NTIYVESLDNIKIYNDSSFHHLFELRGEYLDRELFAKSHTAKSGLTKVDLRKHNLSRVVIEFDDLTYYIELDLSASESKIPTPTFKVASDEKYDLVRNDDTVI